MPDLVRSSVLDWLREQEPDRPALWESPVTSAEAHPDAEAALIRLGEVLEAALARDPARLSADLQVEPAGDELRTMLGQLGVPRVLRLIGWIMQGGLPEADAVLDAVLASDPAGTGQFLHAVQSGAARPPLLERLYTPERLGALLAACQPAAAVREAA